MLKTALVVVLGLGTVIAPQPGQPGRDRRTGLIVGQVLDQASGRPVSGALVDAVAGPLAPPQEGGSRPAPERFPARLTGSDGRFVLRGLPAGRYTITANRPGYLDGAYGQRRPGGAPQALVLAEGQRSGVVPIYMWRHASITGVVIDEAGEPVVGIRVRALRRAMVGGQRRFVNTGTLALSDDRGVYRIADLLPGDYVVVAPASQVSVPASAAIEMRQGGGPSAGAAEIGASVSGGASSIRIADSIMTLGRSAIGPAPADEAPVYVYPSTFHPDTASPVRATVFSVAPGEAREGIDLRVRPVVTRRVSGVLTSGDGQVDGIPIRIVPEEVEDSPIDLEVASTVTNRAGAFTFPAVPVGHYLVQSVKGPPPAVATTTIHTAAGTFSSVEDQTAFSGPMPFAYRGGNVWWASVPLAVGRENIAGLAVRLGPGLRVSGRAEFDGTGRKPAPSRLGQVPVVVEPASAASRVRPLPGRFDSSGQFSVQGLPAGKYVLRIGAAPQGWSFRSATYNGFDVSDAPLDLAGDALGIVVSFTDRVTQVSGTVRRADGAMDPDATVLVFPSDPQTWTTWGLNPKRFRSARATPTGSFQITALPPGDYCIVALPEEQSSDWQEERTLHALSRVASTLALSEGDSRTQDLRTREVR